MSSRSHPALGRRLVFTFVLSALAGAREATAQCAGAPTFAPPAPYAIAAAGPMGGIAHGDLDRDGDLDLVTCSGSQISVLANQGAGSFAAQGSFAATINLVDLVVADFDEDGFPDVAAIGTFAYATAAGVSVQAQIMTFRNESTSAGIALAAPVAAPVGTLMVYGSIGRALRASDLNADGILDLVAVDGNTSNIWVLLGQGSIGLGDGTFGTAAPYPVTGTLHQDVAIGDFNQDGAPDLAAIRYGGCNCPTPVTLLAGVLDATGTPTGTFVPAGTFSIPGPSECENIEVADLDGDGFLDLAISSYLSVEIAWGTGGFSFVTATHALGAYPVQLAVGDFSADGRADLAVVRAVPSGGSANLTVLVGQPAGAFTGYDYVLDPSLASCVCAADFDGDGRLDLAAGHANGVVDVCLGACTPAAPHSVSVIWPNGGEIILPGISRSLAWSKSASVALVDVDVSHDGGATFHRIATAVSGTAAPWIATLPGTGAALLRVSASGIPSVADASDAPFAILGAGTATSNSVGPGCGPGPSPSALAFGLPRLGHPVAISLQGASPWSLGGLLVSPGSPSPVPVSATCTAYVDAGSASLLFAFITGGSGEWNDFQPIPALNALAGSAFRAQVAVLLPGAAFEVSNGVELVLGF
jgi:FG-GAP-like repeat